MLFFNANNKAMVFSEVSQQVKIKRGKECLEDRGRNRNSALRKHGYSLAINGRYLLKSN